MQHQDSPTYIDGVTADDKSDPSRLPSYRETRRFRFHPYSRPIPVLVNEADRLLVGFKFSSFCFPLSSLTTIIQNTIYDDERVVLNVPPLPARRVAAVEFIHFYSDLIFMPNSYSTHFCPKLLTSMKNVSSKIWNARLHLNYAFNVFPQPLWSVFLFSSIFL